MCTFGVRTTLGHLNDPGEKAQCSWNTKLLRIKAKECEIKRDTCTEVLADLQPVTKQVGRMLHPFKWLLCELSPRPEQPEIAPILFEKIKVLLIV